MPEGIKAHLHTHRLRRTAFALCVPVRFEKHYVFFQKSLVGCYNLPVKDVRFFIDPRLGMQLIHDMQPFSVESPARFFRNIFLYKVISQCQYFYEALFTSVAFRLTAQTP